MNWKVRCGLKQASDPRDRIVPLAELAGKVEDARARGLRVVLTNGCFDLLHVGHVRYLYSAAAEGDLLVVALNSDAGVRRLKGAGRPIQPEEERAEMLAALWPVDYVTIFDEPTVERVILALRPDVHCKGTDYTVETVPERAVVQSVGGDVRIVGDSTDHATTDLISRIRALD
jgi:rfaE bifunctional protein nucleotidyltransferase chain/domain